MGFKFKKIIAIVLVFIVVLAISACGKRDSQDDIEITMGDTHKDSENTPPKSSNTSGETYNVVIEWISTGKVPSEENMRKVEEAINKITVPAIGVTVTLYPVELSNLASANKLAISTGEKIDLICSVGTGVGELVNSGLIIQLDDLFEKYGADMKKALGDAILGGYYGGKLYGIPNAYMQAEQYGFNARTDLLKKYGIEINPDKLYTLDELEEIFATIKAGEGDGFYCIAGITSKTDLFTDYLGTVDTLGATTASGGLLLENNWNNTTIENIYASEQYAKFAQRMYDWARKGYIPPDAASNTEKATTQIKAGNFLGRFYYTKGSAPVDFKAQTGYDCTVINMFEPFKMTSRFQHILWSIPITSKNPEKAFQFLNMLYADNDIDTMLQFGLEGETWEVVEEDDKGNRVIKFVDGLDANTAPYYCAAGVYGDRLSWPIWYPNKITFNEELREFNKSVKRVSPALGYCFVITDEVAGKYAAASSVISQYVGIISAGALDPNEILPKFNKELEAAGIYDVIAENQRQLDTWLTEKRKNK